METEQESLQSLQKLIKQNKELDIFSTVFTDTFLLRFVRGKKCKSEQAYKVLLSYIALRTGKYRDWFKSIRPTSYRDVDTRTIRVLKHRDHLNRLIVLVEIQYWDVREIPVDDARKLTMLTVHEFLNFEKAEEVGIVLIYNLAKFSIRPFLTEAPTPSNVNQAIDIFYSNVPVRCEALHILNQNFLFTMTIKAIKPLLPFKLKKKIHLHSNDYQSLHEAINPEILPNCLGGHILDEDAFDDEFMDSLFCEDSHYERFSKLL